MVKDEHYTRACLETYETLMIVGHRRFKPTDQSVERLAEKYRSQAESNPHG